MLAKKIDLKLCDSCAKCVQICEVNRVMAMGPDGYPSYVKPHKCIDCGHCLALCPKGAIAFSREPKDEAYYADGIEFTDVADPVLRLLFSQRSNVFFSRKELEAEKLELILEAMVRCPSAGNEQNRNYYVFGTREKLEKLVVTMREHSQKSAMKLKNPAIRRMFAKVYAQEPKRELFMRNRSLFDLPKKERIEKVLELFDDLDKQIGNKDYTFFRGATAAILVTSKQNYRGIHKDFFKADVEIAVTHGSIAAASMGVASCRMGLAEIAFKQNKALQKEFGVPENERVDGLLALGYSESEWKRIPPRGPVKLVRF